MSGNQTTQLLQDYLDRLRDGDASARDELIRIAWRRLAHLTALMARDFPRVRRWIQEEDVSQGAAIRLRVALNSVTPTDVPHFLSLVSRQIRWELLELTRRYRRYLGQSQAPSVGGVEPDDQPGISVADVGAESSSELMGWSEFHEQVDALPDDIRKVFEMVWYEGLTHEEVANILGVATKTIQRRMLGARLKLGRFLKEIAHGT